MLRLNAFMYCQKMSQKYVLHWVLLDMFNFKSKYIKGNMWKFNYKKLLVPLAI